MNTQFQVRRAIMVVAGMMLVCATIRWSVAQTNTLPPAQKNSQSSVAVRMTEDVFGLTKVHRFHLDVPLNEWAAMQDVSGRMPFGPGGPGTPPVEQPPLPARTSTDVHKGGSFAMEFPWAGASLTADGKVYRNVGLRYKGGGSYMGASKNLKRNLKVELDHYDNDLRFQGMKTLNLNAGAADPTRMRETLAYEVYRAAGVPAPRTAFAEVTLSVPGKYDRALLGTYTVIEQVDKDFLKDRLGSSKGLLMKPEVSFTARHSSFEYLGESWNRYRDSVGSKREPSKKEAQRYIDFARLLHQAGDETFGKEVGNYLDVDEFLRFLACTAYLSNMDNIFSNNHNAYIYLRPDTNKFVFIPWDVDLSLGSGPEQLMDLSINHPYMGQSRLVERLLADKEIGQHFKQLMQELSGSAFSTTRLLKELDELEAATGQMLAREANVVRERNERVPGAGQLAGMQKALRKFVTMRPRSIAAQLEGRSEGFVPGKGGPTPNGGPGGQPRFGNMVAEPLLHHLDTDGDGMLSKGEWLAWSRKMYARSVKDLDGKVDERNIAAALNQLLPGSPEERQNRRQPGVNGPGNVMAGPIIRRADVKGVGRVTVLELVASAEKLFDMFDTSKSGKLSQSAFANLLNELFPMPNFGPPGGPPPSELQNA